MRSARGNAGWILVVLAAFGWVASASAQSTPTAARVVPNNYARLSEIHVQLAWIGDPATQPCHLRVRAVGPNLEVGGTVPDERVKARALQLAARSGGMPILDSIVVRPAPLPRPRTVFPDRLHETCVASLHDGAPRPISDLLLIAEPSGRVTVQGTVPSYDEKLAVSQRLRRVPGCTAVENQLEVMPFHIEGKAVALVTPDGRHKVPVTPPAPTQPAMLPPVAANVTVPVAKPAVPATEAKPSIVAKGTPRKQAAPGLFFLPKIKPAPETEAQAAAERERRAAAAPVQLPEPTPTVKPVSEPLKWTAPTKPVAPLPAPSPTPPATAQAKSAPAPQATAQAKPAPAPQAAAQAKPAPTPAPVAALPKLLPAPTTEARPVAPRRLIPPLPDEEKLPAQTVVPAAALTQTPTAKDSPAPVLAAAVPPKPPVATPPTPSAPSSPYGMRKVPGSERTHQFAVDRLKNVPAWKPKAAAVSSTPAPAPMPQAVTSMKVAPQPTRTASSMPGPRPVAQSVASLPGAAPVAQTAASMHTPGVPFQPVTSMIVDRVEMQTVSSMPKVPPPDAPSPVATSPISPAPPTVEPVLYREKPPAPSEGGVSSGVIVLAETGDQAVDSPEATSAQMLSWLKQLVIDAAGADAKDVQVLPYTSDSMLIQLTLHDPAAAPACADRVLKIPELVPFRVFLEVQAKE